MLHRGTLAVSCAIIRWCLQFHATICLDSKVDRHMIAVLSSNLLNLWFMQIIYCDFWHLLFNFLL